MGPADQRSPCRTDLILPTRRQRCGSKPNPPKNRPNLRPRHPFEPPATRCLFSAPGQGPSTTAAGQVESSHSSWLISFMLAPRRRLTPWKETELLEARERERIPAERQRIAATAGDDARRLRNFIPRPEAAVGFKRISAGRRPDAAFLCRLRLGQMGADQQADSQVAAPNARQHLDGTAQPGTGGTRAPARRPERGLARGPQGHGGIWAADHATSQTPVHGRIIPYFRRREQDIVEIRWAKRSGERRLKVLGSGRSTFAGSPEQHKGGENSNQQTREAWPIQLTPGGEEAGKQTRPESPHRPIKLNTERAAPGVAAQKTESRSGIQPGQTHAGKSWLRWP